MDLLIRRPIIKSQMLELPMSKRYQTRVRNPALQRSEIRSQGSDSEEYQKVRIPRLQGLDPRAAFVPQPRDYGAPRKSTPSLPNFSRKWSRTRGSTGPR